MRRMKATALLILALAQIAVPPIRAQQTDPSGWPAKDTHQGFTVAAQPYSYASLSKKTFGKADPRKAGILAIDVVFKNDLKEPVHVNLSTICLDVDEPTGHHSRLPAMGIGQVAKQVAHPKGPSAVRPPRFPVPLPPGDSKERDIEDKLRPLTPQSDVVPPNGTLRGMLFFDISGHFELVPRASLYVPDVKSVGSSDAMIYFEVPFGPRHST